MNKVQIQLKNPRISSGLKIVYEFQLYMVSKGKIATQLTPCLP
jgi:hypothetical protein